MFRALLIATALAPALLLAADASTASTDSSTTLITTVCDSILATPLGRIWPEPGEARPQGTVASSTAGECRDFRSVADLPYLTRPVENWVHRCSTSLAGGTFERRVYPLGDDPEPRWGLAFWAIGALSFLPPHAASLAEVESALVHQLTRRLGDGRALEPRAGLDGLHLAWEGVVREFVTPTGVVRVYHAEDGRFGDSLLVARWSPQLLIEERRDWSGDAGPDGDQDPDALRTRERRAEAAAALGPRDARLHAALTANPPGIAGLSVVRGALAEADTLRAGTRRDLLLWSAHLWIVSLGALPDTVAVEMIEPALSPLGVSLHEGMDGEYRTYEGSLLVPLLERTGRSPLADHAFADRLESGWDSSGTGEFEWDAYRSIIARGETFLRRFPKSAAWREVALLVAQSHETAWSLDCAGLGAAESAAARRSVAADQHRQRALALYRLLVLEPLPEVGTESARSSFGFTLDAASRTRDLRRRIRRLELGIDTGNREHVYYSC